MQEKKGRKKQITIRLDSELFAALRMYASRSGMSMSSFSESVLRQFAASNTPSRYEEVVSVREAAYRLSKSRRTIYRMIKNGEFGPDGCIEYGKGHKGIGIKASAIKEYLNRHTKHIEVTDDGCLSVKESAVYMIASEDTVYGWIRKGLLKAHKNITGRWRIEHSELDRFKAEHHY